MADKALYQLRQMVARLMGSGIDAEMQLAAATGGHATTGCQASALDSFESSFFIDWWIRFYSGTHKDVTSLITTFTKTNGVLVWSPAITAVTDATDLFELHRDFSPAEIIDAINLAIWEVESEALVDKVDESLVVNDLLTDGLFEVWSSSSTLTNWTKAGTGSTLARESTIKREGSYSAKLTNQAGQEATLSQSIGNYPLYAGENSVKASLYARVACNTASRVRIRLTDGVTTWNSDYHDGYGWREGQSEPLLKIENCAISTAATELTASFRIETGAAISAYVDKMWLVCGDTIYEYTVPSGFYTIDAIYQEQSTVGRFSPKWNRIDPEKGWKLLLNGSTKKIWFDSSYVKLTSGRKLRIEGQAKASSLTLDADTTPINPAYIVYMAKALLHQAKIGTSRSEWHGEQFKMAMATAMAEKNKLQVMLRGQRVES